MQGIKNVIFDLGGVIINLDVNRTIAEFNKIATTSFESIYTQKEQIELFNQFDKGLISTVDFIKQLKLKIGFAGEDEVILKAWNAMLLGVPEKRLDTLVEMKQNYNTYLLSNTCEPHIESFEKDLEHKYGIKNFNDYFDKVYYSCRMGMRKPDEEIFLKVLFENDLNPKETVFIDDTMQHVKGAGNCGINAYLLEKDREFSALLKELNLL